MSETKRVEDFLKTYHARFPGCTSACVKGARGEDGLSSYEVLAELVGASGTVLDLACGDGFLLSVVKERKPDSSLSSKTWRFASSPCSPRGGWP